MIRVGDMVSDRLTPMTAHEVRARIAEFERENGRRLRTWCDEYARAVLARLEAYTLTVPARGVKIPSRRRARVWLKRVKYGLAPELPRDVRKARGVHRVTFRV